MRARHYIALIICLLSLLSIEAQTAQKPILSLTHEGDSMLHLHFESPGSLPHVDTLGEQGFSRLTWEGMTFGNGHAGYPDLPSIPLLVRLPKGSTLEVSHVEARSTVWPWAVPKDTPLVPATEGWAKDQEQPPYRPDRKVYGSRDPFRGGARVAVESLGTMGTDQLFRVTVHPMEYLPLEGTLTYDNHIDATLRIGKSGSTTAANAYLVVSRPQFREGLQPFVRWKRQQGYTVTELYADTYLRDSVRAMISHLWSGDCGQWPKYVLLVGDVSHLQAYPGTTHPAGLDNHVTDLYYVEHTGDYLPDALLGRWPVNDSAELAAVVNKTVAYEQALGLDTAALRRLLLVAGDEDRAPAPVTTNGQVHYVAHEARLAHPSFDTLCFYNPASANQRANILDALGQGVSLLNYTAHCTAAGWSSPAVTFTSIDTLDCHQAMLYVNNCCLSNAFDGTCFGEQLLRKADGGAIGVIGATNSTLWNEDYYWAVGPKYPLSTHPVFDSLRPGAFDRWLGRVGGVHSQGELLAAGNLAVTAFGSPYDKFYWETYCLLGDPSLEPWTSRPLTLDLHLANGMPTDGAGCLYLGGTAGATVTAMQHDSVLGIGIIGADGSLALQLGVSIDTTPLILTASRSGYIPRIDTLMARPAEGIAVALREVTIGDNAVGCRIENVGTVPLYGLRVTMSQPYIDSTTDALVAEQQTAIDSLLPRHGQALTLPLTVTAAGQRPYWRAHLIVRDSAEGTLCSVELRHPYEAAYPTAFFRLLETTGDAIHDLLPHHEYLLEATLEGDTAASAAVLVTAVPAGDTLTAFTTSQATLTIPLTTPDTLTHLHLQATMTLGNHRDVFDRYLVGGHRTDSFEEGMRSYPWQGSGTRPWVVDSTVSHSGRYCLRSGDIDDRQTSDLVLEVLMPHRDTLSYWLRTSSENNYDKLVFSVDGTRRGIEMWGESNWKRFTVVIDAGRHTLRWRYVKDDSGTSGADCAWLDDVKVPLAWWDSAYGCFGDLPTLTVTDIQEQPTVNIYPNPSTGIITIEGAVPGEICVTDLWGRTLLTSPHDGHTVLHLTSLPDGIYLLQLTSSVGRSHHKLIIRHLP